MIVQRIEGRYNPHEVENEIKRFWEEQGIYRKLKESLRGRPRFRFLDGPPYTSNDLPHAGTAFNKVLKDAVLRFWRLLGYDVDDTPGYDCHGLPIEVLAERRLGISVKKEIESVGVERFIEECKRIAENGIRGLTKWFKELGVFMDWDRPYITMRDEYIEAEWWFLKKCWERGLLEQDLRIVYWCPRCSTTLAEYEVKYRDIEDPSIYVAFPLEEDPSTCIVIWTTTPWTLPANTFVMVHPGAEYVKVRVGGRILVVAKKRLLEVLKEWGVHDYEIVGEVRGEDLVGKRYINPLEEIVPLQKKLREHHVIVAAPEYVSLEEGTGFVHAAPGHGFEDFEVAKRIGLKDVVCPVDEEGRFTEEAGKYGGKHVREANAEIVEDLKRLEALIHASTIVHRYPVCWRCGTPVILRATRQWVIRVTKVIDRVREEAQRANWIPRWALSRLWSMLENPKDWVVSRQRYWGTPLPIWVCEKCGNIVVVGSVEELLELGGERPKELHRPWIDKVVLKCPRCGGAMRRVPDVADVWLDSGVAFYASLGHPEKASLSLRDVVADFITEGHDQTRGWFFSMLRVGTLAFDTVPYRNVLVHGFVLDEKGREMHKSLGNYVGTDEILAKVGSDVFRTWILTNTVWEDVRFSWRGLEEMRKNLGIAWNVFVFASTYMNLDGFDPEVHRLQDYVKHLRVEDRWILSRLETLLREVEELMKSFRVHEVARKVISFIVEDVSHWYIKLVRPRVWVEENTPDKMALYTVLYTVLKSWLVMLSLFAPFLSEYLYQRFVKQAEPSSPPSVSMCSWPRLEGFSDKELEKLMEIAKSIVESAAAARMSAGIKLRQPLRALILYTDNDDVKRALQTLRDVIAFMSNVKEVAIQSRDRAKEVMKLRAKPRFASLGPKHRKMAKKVAEYIEKNCEIVAQDIVEKGVHRACIDGYEIEIGRDDVDIIEEPAPGFVVRSEPWGVLALDTRISREELVEGLARDIVRRIQFMRKEAGLEISEFIEASIDGPSDKLELLKAKLSYVASETRAKHIALGRVLDNAMCREWEIDEERYVVCIRRAS